MAEQTKAQQNMQATIGGLISAYNLYDAYNQRGDASKQLKQLSGVADSQFANTGQTRDLILRHLADRAPYQDQYSGQTGYLSERLPILGDRLDASINNLAPLAGSIRNIGLRYQQEDDALKGDILGRLDTLDDRIAGLTGAWAPGTVASAEDISNRANQLYDAQRAALMDVIARVSSESSAQHLLGGMAGSTADLDAQRSVVQKYAPLMMNARVQSYNDAAQHFQNQINTEYLGRNKALEELIATMSPGIEGRMKMYRPRDAEMSSATAAAELERGIASLMGDQFQRTAQGIGTIGGLDSNNNSSIYNLLNLLSTHDRAGYQSALGNLTAGRQDYTSANAGVQSNANQLFGNPLVQQGINWIGDKIGGWFDNSQAPAPVSEANIDYSNVRIEPNLNGSWGNAENMWY